MAAGRMLPPLHQSLHLLEILEVLIRMRLIKFLGPIDERKEVISVICQCCSFANTLVYTTWHTANYLRKTLEPIEDCDYNDTSLPLSLTQLSSFYLCPLGCEIVLKELASFS